MLPGIYIITWKEFFHNAKAIFTTRIAHGIITNKNNNEYKLLFKPDNAQFTKRVNVNTELKRILKKHFGIEDITTHSLRHTFGTRCIESGMAPVVVQRLMGHKDIRITLNTYTSVFDSFKEKEVDKVNKYLLQENMLQAIKLLQEEKSEKDLEQYR